MMTQEPSLFPPPTEKKSQQHSQSPYSVIHQRYDPTVTVLLRIDIKKTQENQKQCRVDWQIFHRSPAHLMRHLATLAHLTVWAGCLQAPQFQCIPIQ
jgi:hypothetical protein